MDHHLFTGPMPKGFFSAPVPSHKFLCRNMSQRHIISLQPKVAVADHPGRSISHVQVHHSKNLCQKYDDLGAKYVCTSMLKLLESRAVQFWPWLQVTCHHCNKQPHKPTAEHDRTCRCNVLNAPDSHKHTVITSEIPCRNSTSTTTMNTNRLVRHQGTSSHSMSIHIPCNGPNHANPINFEAAGTWSAECANPALWTKWEPIQIHHKWGVSVVTDNLKRISWHVKLKWASRNTKTWRKTSGRGQAGWTLRNAHKERNRRFMDFHQWHWEHQWYYSEPWWTIHTLNMLPNQWHRKCRSLLRNPCPPTTASRAASKAGPGFLATTSAGVSSTSLTMTFGRAGHMDVEKLCRSTNRGTQIHSGPVRPLLKKNPPTPR